MEYNAVNHMAYTTVLRHISTFLLIFLCIYIPPSPPFATLFLLSPPLFSFLIFFLSTYYVSPPSPPSPTPIPSSSLLPLPPLPHSPFLPPTLPSFTLSSSPCLLSFFSSFYPPSHLPSSPSPVSSPSFMQPKALGADGMPVPSAPGTTTHATSDVDASEEGFGDFNEGDDEVLNSGCYIYLLYFNALIY